MKIIMHKLIMGLVLLHVTKLCSVLASSGKRERALTHVERLREHSARLSKILPLDVSLVASEKHEAIALKSEIVLRLSEECVTVMKKKFLNAIKQIAGKDYVKELELLVKNITNLEEQVYNGDPCKRFTYTSILGTFYAQKIDFVLREDISSQTKLLTEIYFCFDEKLRSLPLEYEIFKKTAQLEPSSDYFTWYYQNALTEFLDLELSGNDNRLDDIHEYKASKKIRKEEIDNQIEYMIAEYAKSDDPVQEIVDAFFQVPFSWSFDEKRVFQTAEWEVIIKKLEESCDLMLEIDQLFPPQWKDSICELISKYNKNATFKQNYETGCKQTSDLQELSDDLENGIFTKLNDIQEFMYDELICIEHNIDEDAMINPMGIMLPKTTFSSRKTPKKAGRAAIKSLRKIKRFDGCFLKDSVGSCINVVDEGNLERFHYLLSNFLDIFEVGPSEVFNTECASLLDLPQEFHCQGIRLMELKVMSELGYKDVKMIFQACIDGKFYNFEMIFILQNVYEAKSKSHVFYEFTRQFGVHKNKKNMDHVLLSMAKDIDPTSKDEDNIQILRRLSSSIRKSISVQSQPCEHEVSLSICELQQPADEPGSSDEKLDCESPSTETLPNEVAQEYIQSRLSKRRICFHGKSIRRRLHKLLVF